MKYPVYGDFFVYRKWTRNGDVIVPCENGTFFDISSCSCVKNNEQQCGFAWHCGSVLDTGFVVVVVVVCLFFVCFFVSFLCCF